MDRDSGDADSGRVVQPGDESADAFAGESDASSRNDPGWQSDESGRPTYVPPRGRAYSASGRRPRGLTTEQAEEAAKRDPHQQLVTFNDRRIVDFDGVQFIAHLGAEMKFARNGDLIVTMQIPFEFKHLAFPLSNAFGIPLSVDIQVWRPYADYEDITNGKEGAWSQK